jgi:hypothetical protein
MLKLHQFSYSDNGNMYWQETILDILTLSHVTDIEIALLLATDSAIHKVINVYITGTEQIYCDIATTIYADFS